MLTILGNATRDFCDGLSRRNFLRIGALGLGGMTLPRLLAAEQTAGISGSHKSVINVFLPGGAPHQDMWDLKPDAPSEIRGEFNPIETSVPGIEICELFPRIAQMMDKFTIIRSIGDSEGRHSAYQSMTGRRESGAPRGGWPAVGAWASRLLGPAVPGIPPHMSLMYKPGHDPWGYAGTGSFLGQGHGPFRLVGGKDSNSSGTAEDMVLKGITPERLQDRRALLKSLDGFRRRAEAMQQMAALDFFTQQAFGILTTSKLAEALDISKEDPQIVERYGKPDDEFRADGAPKVTTNFLVARRLVEAGARYVSLNFSRWDWHGGNFKRGRQDMPMLDQALSALVTDLHERGLDKDVAVICTTEFGRTPKINNKAGRDHWPKLNACILAGGDMNHGQVIGSSNRLGEVPQDRPVKFQEIFATLYRHLGLIPLPERIFDFNARPQTPVADGIQPLRELVG